MQMSLEQELQVIFLGAMFMVFSYFVIRHSIALWERFKFEYEYLKHPRLVPYCESLACGFMNVEEHHEWVDSKLALRGLPYGEYKVCLTCGSISGNSEFMISPEVLKHIVEALSLASQKLELEKAVQERIRGLTEGYVDHYIKRTFAQEINDVHFAEKLRGLAKYTITALADASEKVASELTAQTELDVKYKDWPSKMKGNA